VRKTLLSLAAIACLAAPSAALAGSTPPDTDTDGPTIGTLPTLPSPVLLPVVRRVTDVPSAERFTRAFAIRNAARFLNTDRDRVRVTDVLSTCLRSPVTGGQFGCVFALNAAVVVRNSYDYDWDSLSRYARLSSHHTTPPDPITDPDPDTDPIQPPASQRRVSVQRFGCLGEIDIRGGATVNPQASVHFLRCARNNHRVIRYPIATPLDG
jgi:hypothetical protein